MFESLKSSPCFDAVRADNPRFRSHVAPPQPVSIEKKPRSRTAARWMAGFLAILIAISGSACQAPKVGHRHEQAPANVMALAPGDVIRLSFPGAPELNQSQKLQADGKLNLPQIGEVNAAGKSVRELQAELARLYKPNLQNNEVVITVESKLFPVYVSGAVGRPGKVMLDRPVTVLEVIMEAGGFAANLADLKRVKVVRLKNGQHQTQILDLRPAMSGQTTNAFYVRGYDVIFVPEKWL